jgi:hypothetical protein
VNTKKRGHLRFMGVPEKKCFFVGAFFPFSFLSTQA